MENSSRKENTPTTNPESSAPSTPGQLLRENFFKRRSRKFLSVLRRVGSEWSCLLQKIKQATQVTYSDEEALDSLFESSDDDFFERVPKPKKGCNLSAAEIRFLEEYKKCKLLDEYFSNSHRSTNTSEDMPASTNTPHSHLYKALDVLRSRQQSEGAGSRVSLPAGVEDLELTQNESILKDRIYSRDGNLGNALWEIRRARWLTSDGCENVEEKVGQRAAGLSLKQIPSDLYPRIYRDFVEKAKPLKQGKYVNLEDMVAVINAGWVHEKVWEAASKGLG